MGIPFDNRIKAVFAKSKIAGGHGWDNFHDLQRRLRLHRAG